MVRVGIEPTSKVLETFILPLNYRPIYLIEMGGFEPPRLEFKALCLTTWLHLNKQETKN